jgi:RNA polymerase sigma-70 factor (ECF subfamily)
MENTASDKYLVSRIAEGDEQAFKKLFNRYFDRLFVFVEQLIHSKADTEEILQDTFLKVWQSHHLLANQDEPAKYIYVMARNRTISYLRKMASEKKLMAQLFANMSDVDDAIEEQIRSQEYQTLINGAVNKLTDQQRMVFSMSREQGMMHDQIAEQLGLSRSRVKNIIVDALKQIRVYLQQHSDLVGLIFWLHAAGILFL